MKGEPNTMPINNLNRGNFKFLFNHTLIPTMDGIVGAEIFGASLSELRLPVGKGLYVKKGGDEFTFTDIPIMFIVDKYLLNWEAYFNWMMQMKNGVTGALSDSQITGTFQMLSDNGEILREIKYHGLWPNDLSPIEFETTSDDTQYLISTMTMAYNYAEIMPLRKEIREKLRL